MPKFSTAHKIHHRIKTRIHDRAAKKSAKNTMRVGMHEVHADNLYKLAHPHHAKHKALVKRSFMHVGLPLLIIAAIASFAIGAEVVTTNNTKTTKPSTSTTTQAEATTSAAPPVPANSVCRIYDAQKGGLTPEDHRIIITGTPKGTDTITTFSGLKLNYLYYVVDRGMTYDLSDVVNGQLETSNPAYIKACALNPGDPMPPFNTRWNLVNQQYKDFFGRNATDAEQAYWASTGYSAQQIVDWFVNQESTQRGSLVRLYKAYYMRWPDAGGYSYWIGRLKAGTSLTAASDFFAQSSEFKNRYGSLDNKQFVILVYNNVMQRTPDSGGYNYWVAQLDQKKISRGGMMLKFSDSNEFKRKYGLDSDLVGVTLRLLRRPATDAELQQWNPDLSANELAYPIIFQTQEYSNRVIK